MLFSNSLHLVKNQESAMVYQKVTFVWLVECFLIVAVLGAHSRLIFHSPTQERPIEALACGLESLNSARGVRFDTTTNECTSLSEAWFSNETIAQNRVYYLLTMYEELFNTTLDTGLRRIPGAFNTGYTVVTTFDTKDIKFNSIAGLRLYVSEDPEFLLLSMGLRYYWNKISYNTYNNKKWGAEEGSALVVTESNTVYQIGIAVTESLYMIYVNGQSVYNFTQRYSEQAVYFRFDSKSMVCQRIQYTFPV